MTEIITSIQNSRVKLAIQLQARARVRRKERKIVLEGTRLIADALEQGHVPHYVFYQAQHADYNLIASLQAVSSSLFLASQDIINHISDTKSPQGIVAVFPLPQPDLPRDPERILILDGISEPGNMGTILRTAAAADVQTVILAPDCVDPYNPKVLRSGMGAHFRIPIVEASWPEIRSYCDGLTKFIATGDGEHIYTQVDWHGSWALVIGSEAHGISKNAALFQGEAIRIPLAANTESLNAAVAAGIILFEAQRQMRSD